MRPHFSVFHHPNLSLFSQSSWLCGLAWLERRSRQLNSSLYYIRKKKEKIVEWGRDIYIKNAPKRRDFVSRRNIGAWALESVTPLEREGSSEYSSR